MARISGIELPDGKRVDYSLTLLYGIGWNLSGKILKKTGIQPETRVSKLSEKQLASLNHALEEYKIEGDLRREIRGNIQRLKDISAYRGIRHSRGLPVRGQRTRSNARTKRGARKTVGAFKKEALAKIGTPAPEKKE